MSRTNRRRGPNGEVYPNQNLVKFCPTHNVLCVARHTGASKTYYYCPVKGCGFSHGEPRPAPVFPPSFQAVETPQLKLFD